MFSRKVAWISAVSIVLAGFLTSASAQEGSVLPTAAPEALAPSVASAAPEAGETTEVLTPYEMLLQRLEAAERRIRQLEYESEESSWDEPRLPPPSGPLFPVPSILLVHDPEVAAAREQLQEIRRLELPPEVPDEPGRPRVTAPRERRWYEKIALRGYTQFRDNETIYHVRGSASPQTPGDSSVGRDRNFLIRRARLIWQGNISDHVAIYFQPDFASGIGATDINQFAQIRDWYADIFIDKTQIHRFRIGQSKVPYGWENLQSSSNRVPLDRGDAFNSALRNERDLGLFYYWTPIYAQKLFRYVLAENLKGSGNYGVLGFGVYAGQGGSFNEQNENVHVVARLAVPYELDNGQIIELGVQALTGKYVVLSSPIRPLGEGGSFRPSNTLDGTIREERNRGGIRDERLGWTAVLYPRPIGLQAEWTIGRGPGLNDDQTRVEERALYGGYLMALAKIDTSQLGLFYPFVRWQYFKGGYKTERNAPYVHIRELELGTEWQITPAMELTLCYSYCDRTNTTAVDREGFESYRQWMGSLLRMQFQVNY